MQTLYSWEMDHEIPLTYLEGQLNSQVEKSVALYITYILFLEQICTYSMVDKARRMAKYIQTEDDAHASTTIAANVIIQYIKNDEEFNAFVKKRGLLNYVPEEMVKTLFTELTGKARYKEYVTIEKPTLEQDKEILQTVIKKVFQTSKDLELHLEEIFLNYSDDAALLLHVIDKYIAAFEPGKKNTFFQNSGTWEEERQFAANLLAQTIQHNDELIAIIQPKLKNWEMDRVAILDLILLKLAVCELKYFPTVPIKVSINEYIDISKLYSTPKSKDFVNGVLDKIKNELMEKGEIKKFGRGLVE
jgi:N utilization substance protein B